MHQRHHLPAIVHAACVARWAGATLSAIVWLGAASGSAEPRSDGESVESSEAPEESQASSAREHAAVHFRRGIQLYQAKRYAEAFAAFLEARRIYPSPAFSFNLARSAERMNDTAKALRYYRDYLRESPNAEDRDAVSEFVQSLEKALASRGLQQVTVLSEPDGAAVYVGEKPVGITPWTGELVPGSYALRLVRSGYEDGVEKLELLPERAVDVNVQLTPVTARPAIMPSPKSQHKPIAKPTHSTRPAEADVSAGPSAKIQVWTWGVLAGSATALGGAVVYELFRRNAEAEVARHDTQLARLAEYQDMKDYQRDARILLGIGGGLALLGGGLLLWDLSSTPKAAPKLGSFGSGNTPPRSSDGVSAQVACNGLFCGFSMSKELE
jgi:hypothetical protein